MKKTFFRPDMHGFAFVNTWSFDPSERMQMANTLHGSVSGAVNSLASSLTAIPFVETIMQQWIGKAEPVYYGLCGGMAFASLDYFKKGQKLPRGAGYSDNPKNDTPSGKTMRDYLWRRQLESMSTNVPMLLVWMAVQHMGAILGGPQWLLERTKEEWEKLKEHIDNDEPWPICLVGSSTNPFHNHQVLVYGYDDPGDGTGVLYLYDMNCPDKEQKTCLDFRGEQLQATETCAIEDRGELRGFFCEIYTQATPPAIEYKTGWA